MRLRFFSCILPTLGHCAVSPTNRTRFSGEFLSFTSLQEVIHDDQTVYGASQQGVFIFDDVYKTTERLTKVSGLNDFDIVDIGFHRGLGLAFCGHREI